MLPSLARRRHVSLCQSTQSGTALLYAHCLIAPLCPPVHQHNECVAYLDRRYFHPHMLSLYPKTECLKQGMRFFFFSLGTTSKILKSVSKTFSFPGCMLKWLASLNLPLLLFLILCVHMSMCLTYITRYSHKLRTLFCIYTTFTSIFKQKHSEEHRKSNFKTNNPTRYIETNPHTLNSWCILQNPEFKLQDLITNS